MRVAREGYPSGHDRLGSNLYPHMALKHVSQTPPRGVLRPNSWAGIPREHPIVPPAGLYQRQSRPLGTENRRGFEGGVGSLDERLT